MPNTWSFENVGNLNKDVKALIRSSSRPINFLTIQLLADQADLQKGHKFIGFTC